MGAIMLATSENTAEEYGGNIKESKNYESFTRGGVVFEAAVVNQVVFLKMIDGSTTSSLSTGDVIGKVPDKYKPYIATDNRDTLSNKRYIVKTNGDIEFRESVPSGTALRGSITYLQA